MCWFYQLSGYFMAGMLYYCFFFVKVLLCVKIDTLSSHQIKKLSDWVVTDWCHPLSESLWVTLLLCWIMINGMGTLSAVDLGSDSKWGKALAMVIPTPQLATNRHRFGSFSIIPPSVSCICFDFSTEVAVHNAQGMPWWEMHHQCSRLNYNAKPSFQWDLLE